MGCLCSDTRGWREENLPCDLRDEEETQRFLQRQGGRRVAVVLFNLGGRRDITTVRPFLFNLFNDPAIIGLPGLFRTPLAKLISSRRETSAQANYALMGGGSTLLPETQKQAEALSRPKVRLTLVGRADKTAAELAADAAGRLGVPTTENKVTEGKPGDVKPPETGSTVTPASVVNRRRRAGVATGT